ncbi:uncharacterized protein LOC130552500 [Triplophysa rosa]|uniref:uncharacterized protein LOC130552500 n=1 Tax=Triplophysa rosa TaxID=992332 RepID=UPI00254612EB|nr:uncharacterized protein LOC130552500 [Triplophysa rosa]
MEEKGQWKDVACRLPLTFVCHEDQLILIKQNLSWMEALIHCRQNHVDLVSVDSEEIQCWVTEVVQHASTAEVWLRLRHSCTLDTMVQMEEKGQWKDVACRLPLTFVCHEDQLILIKQNLSWMEALIHCRQNHVDLVSVDSEEIQCWVTEVVQHASTAEVWLRLRHSCTLNTWYWVNGEMVCYEKWAEGNETAVENCETVMRSGAVQSGGDHRWISLPETERRNFICSRYD